MRINYYRFPEGIEPSVRYQEGADIISAHCDLNGDCVNCPHGNITNCGHWIIDEADDIIEGITITAAKKLLKKYGGFGTTCHCDRYGSPFETTPITLDGNNSTFKYNVHL